MIDRRIYNYIIHFKNIKDEIEIGYTSWKPTLSSRLIPYTNNDSIKCFIPYNRVIHLMENPDKDVKALRVLNNHLI